MTDRVSPEIRSRVMAAVRSKNTKPELAIRRGLHALGFRYSLHARRLPGRPDIVLPKHGAVIFVNGCFWHGHEDCSFARIPATRSEYWQAKIDRNRERDSESRAALEALGWRHLTIWECSKRGTASPGLDETVLKAAEWLTSGAASTSLSRQITRPWQKGRA